MKVKVHTSPRQFCHPPPIGGSVFVIKGKRLEVRAKPALMDMKGAPQYSPERDQWLRGGIGCINGQRYEALGIARVLTEIDENDEVLVEFLADDDAAVSEFLASQGYRARWRPHPEGGQQPYLFPAPAA